MRGKSEDTITKYAVNCNTMIGEIRILFTLELGICGHWMLAPSALQDS